MHCDILNVARRRTLAFGVRGLLIAGIAATLAGCNSATVSGDATGGIPNAYRERHPITVKEGKKSLVVFVGAGRGGLSPTQRAEVLAFAQNWKRDATGGITIDRPVGGENERAADDTLKEALSIIVQSGVPNGGIGIRPYNPGERFGALRFNYPLMVAEAGPCGTWPDDLGASYETKHYENKQFYNFGCATQRAVAAMVAEPADLVQPRAEAPIYTAKRTTNIDKWRKGSSPATTYTNENKGAISDIGK
ncbi:MAG: pilus assembly protein CpaD [Alphaproteobacteria bacterium]|jgi:pilus assembly protein CpaD|nr:pilus assembly protein CpaD [Alphaproteobacteria bacterium]